MNNQQYLSQETYNKMRRDMGNAIRSKNYDDGIDIGARLSQSLFRHFCEELNPSSNGYWVDPASAPIYVAAILAAAEATKNAIGAVMPPDSHFDETVAGILQVNLNSVESVSFFREDDSDD